MTYLKSEDFARTDSGPLERFVRGMIRRMAITATEVTKSKWRMLGQRSGAAGDETPDLEIYPGIGFYSRPPSSGKPEAITNSYGSSRTTAIVATRDEATRQASAGDLQPDEATVFNTLARLIVRADGTVQIVPITGAVPEFMIKGQTYRTAEDTMLTAISTFVSAVSTLVAAVSTFAGTCNTLPATAPAATLATAATVLETAATTLATAITAFKSAGASYLSTVGKVG